jgi:hypothetical protein
MTGPDGAQQHVTPWRQVRRVAAAVGLAVLVAVVWAAAVAAVMNHG